MLTGGEFSGVKKTPVIISFFNKIFREQQHNDELKRNKRDFDDVKDEVITANSTIIELKKTLANHDKEKQRLLENIHHLENNVILIDVLIK